MGVSAKLVETDGEGVPVKQSVGDIDWEVEGLIDTEPQWVTDTLLHPDTETLADWLGLCDEVTVTEGTLEDDKLGDSELEVVKDTSADELTEGLVD